jgi:hypothetical protein
LVNIEVKFLRSVCRGHGIRSTDSADDSPEGFAFVQYFTRVALQDPWPVSSTLRHMSLTTVIATEIIS